MGNPFFFSPSNRCTYGLSQLLQKRRRAKRTFKSVEGYRVTAANQINVIMQEENRIKTIEDCSLDNDRQSDGHILVPEMKQVTHIKNQHKIVGTSPTDQNWDVMRDTPSRRKFRLGWNTLRMLKYLDYSSVRYRVSLAPETNKKAHPKWKWKNSIAAWKSQKHRDTTEWKHHGGKSEKNATELERVEKIEMPVKISYQLHSPILFCITCTHQYFHK